MFESFSDQNVDKML